MRMKLKYLLSLCCLLLLNGCSSSNGSDLQEEIRVLMSSSMQKSDNLLSKFSMRERIHYDSQDARSPFQHKEAEGHIPDHTPPLERYSLDTLNLLGIVQNSSYNYAVFLAPDGKIYEIRNGDLIGAQQGKVELISHNEVIIKEPANPKAGLAERDVILRLKD